jgi:hypothetical protein
MFSVADLLDRAKAGANIDSDYRLAKVIGITHSAEYNRSSSTITTFLNGTQIQTVTDVTRFAGLGDGAGIACFRRTTNGQTAANKFGFKDVLIESF